MIETLVAPVEMLELPVIHLTPLPTNFLVSHSKLFNCEEKVVTVSACESERVLAVAVGKFDGDAFGVHEIGALVPKLDCIWHIHPLSRPI